MSELPSSILPPQLGWKNERVILSSITEVQSSAFVKGIVPKETKAWGWAATIQLENYSDSGEHVGTYTKANRYGKSHMWAGCFEAQDATGQGALWGLEVDVMSTGRAKEDSLRTGLGIIYGRSTGSERAIIDYGLRILPFNHDASKAALRYGVKIDGECEVASISVPAGSWITFDRDCALGITFDEQTGFIHYGLKGQPPALSIQVQTGEILSKGRQIIPPG